MESENGFLVGVVGGEKGLLWFRLTKEEEEIDFVGDDGSGKSSINLDRELFVVVEEVDVRAPVIDLFVDSRGETGGVSPSPTRGNSSNESGETNPSLPCSKTILDFLNPFLEVLPFELLNSITPPPPPSSRSPSSSSCVLLLLVVFFRIMVEVRLISEVGEGTGGSGDARFKVGVTN